MGQNERYIKNSTCLKLLRFDDGFELDASSGELRMGETRLALQPQPFKVLALLVARSGRIVTRDEIRRQLWSTGTFVDFEAGLNFCIRQIRKALGDDPRRPRYVETLHRRGYRFIARVNSFQDTTRFDLHIPDPQPMTGMPRAITLAVLPFSDLSCSRNEGFLADGITELLITYLSTNTPLRVVSRTTTMQYKNTEKSLRRIGRELGADRVLEGAVFQFGVRVRITARLIDTCTDQNEWVACYEAEMQDRLILQDHVASTVACDTALYLMPRLREPGFGKVRGDLPGQGLLKSAGRVWTMPLRTIPASHTGENAIAVSGLVVGDIRHSKRDSGSNQRPRI